MTNLSPGTDEKGSQNVLPISGWESSEEKEMRAFQQLLVIKTLRPDLVTAAVKQFVSAVFGKALLDPIATINLNDIVKQENSAFGVEPFLLVSLPGYDCSTQVENLVQQREMGDKYDALAMGSPEGYAIAEQYIKTAAKDGKWLFLKNVHLSPRWLAKIEMDLHRMSK